MLVLMEQLAAKTGLNAGTIAGIFTAFGLVCKTAIGGRYTSRMIVRTAKLSLGLLEKVRC